MSEDDEKFHKAKLEDLMSIVDQIELYKSKCPETELVERRNIERKILMNWDYKDFITKYYEFLKRVQDEEDNEEESEDKLLHLIRMKSHLLENYRVKSVLKQKEYENTVKTNFNWATNIKKVSVSKY